MKNLLTREPHHLLTGIQSVSYLCHSISVSLVRVSKRY